MNRLEFSQHCHDFWEIAGKRLTGLRTFSTWLPALKARQRKPSHFGSYCHFPAPTGMALADFASSGSASSGIPKAGYGPSTGREARPLASLDTCDFDRSAMTGAPQGHILSSFSVEPFDRLFQRALAIAIICPSPRFLQKGRNSSYREAPGVEIRLDLRPRERH